MSIYLDPALRRGLTTAFVEHITSWSASTGCGSRRVGEATDGSIGTVDEATYDAGKSYVVVDTGPWIFGKKVVLPGGAIQRVDAADRKVWVDLTKTQIENAPEFDELRYRDDDYRTEIGGYYSGHAETDRGYTD